MDCFFLSLLLSCSLHKFSRVLFFREAFCFLVCRRVVNVRFTRVFSSWSSKRSLSLMSFSAYAEWYFACADSVVFFLKYSSEYSDVDIKFIRSHLRRITFYSNLKLKAISTLGWYWCSRKTNIMWSPIAISDTNIISARAMLLVTELFCS